MQTALEFNDLEIKKDLSRNMDVEINRSKRAFSGVVQEAVSKGADYVIRAMPVNDSIKNVLIDVKNSFQTKDFKQILKTAINSSITEGLKILDLPKNVLKDINKIKNVTLKGGLREGVCAAIDIVTNKYLKNNVFVSFIKDFINKTKDFVCNKGFKDKLNSGIKKIYNKVDQYKEKCEKWYDYYNKLDFDNMNNIAKSLKSEKSKVSIDADCIKQNNIIQNMMELVNTKKDKLSPIQLQICSSL